jgi:Flp pilus assembly protein TadG
MKTMNRRLGERGQALLETGMVLLIIIPLTIGVIEFGRAFLVENMITNAARDAARTASIVKSADRDANGMITAAMKSTIAAQMTNQIRTVLSANDMAGLQTIQVDQPTLGGLNMVRATIQGTVPYIFNLVGQNFNVKRVVVFRDEGRL